MHLLVIGWSYRYQNTSKGFREQVKSIFEQFWKIFFSNFLVENWAFFACFCLFFGTQTTNCPKWAMVDIFCPRKFFFQKLQLKPEILVVLSLKSNKNSFLNLHLKIWTKWHFCPIWVAIERHPLNLIQLFVLCVCFLFTKTLIAAYLLIKNCSKIV